LVRHAGPEVQLKQRIILGSFLSLVIAASGCSGSDRASSSTPATTDDYDDVAQAMASVVATTGGGGEVGSLTDSADLSVGVMPLGVTLSATGAFAGNRVGLEYTYKLTCTDSNGSVLSACGPTTDKAQVAVDWSGELMVPNLSATVMRQGSWALAGLQTDTVSFSGSGTFSFDAAFQSAFRPAMAALHLDYSASYEGITMQRALHRLTAGAIHYAVKADRTASTNAKTSDASFDMKADLAFSADGSATLTLDGSHRYSVNTLSGQAARMP
jgi:hypothetical protein